METIENNEVKRDPVANALAFENVVKELVSTWDNLWNEVNSGKE